MGPEKEERSITVPCASTTEENLLEKDQPILAAVARTAWMGFRTLDQTETPGLAKERTAEAKDLRISEAGNLSV